MYSHNWAYWAWYDPRPKFGRLRKYKRSIRNPARVTKGLAIEIRHFWWGTKTPGPFSTNLIEVSRKIGKNKNHVTLGAEFRLAFLMGQLAVTAKIRERLMVGYGTFSPKFDGNEESWIMRMLVKDWVWDLLKGLVGVDVDLGCEFGRRQATPPFRSWMYPIRNPCYGIEMNREISNPK